MFASLAEFLCCLTINLGIFSPGGHLLELLIHEWEIGTSIESWVLSLMPSVHYSWTRSQSSPSNYIQFLLAPTPPALSQPYSSCLSVLLPIRSSVTKTEVSLCPPKLSRNSHPNKQCKLDPIPTLSPKDAVLLTVIT